MCVRGTPTAYPRPALITLPMHRRINGHLHLLLHLHSSASPPVNFIQTAFLQSLRSLHSHLALACVVVSVGFTGLLEYYHCSLLYVCYFIFCGSTIRLLNTSSPQLSNETTKYYLYPSVPQHIINYLRY